MIPVRKLISIKVLLQAITGLMALALVTVFAISAERAFARRAVAERVLAVVDISRDLFAAMQNIRIERGTGNTALETAAPIDRQSQREIATLRMRSNQALDSALGKIAAAGISSSNAARAQILAARTAFDAVRKTADAALEQPKDRRPAALSAAWIASGGMLADSINALSLELESDINRADPLITEMLKIKQLAWVVRDAAGFDRLLVGAAIANGNGITDDQRAQFDIATGRIEAGWQVIAEDDQVLGLASALKDIVARAQNLYFHDLRPQRQALLADLAAGKPAAITGVEWVNLSNPALAALMDVANTAFDLSAARAAEQASEATRDLATASGLAVFFLGVGILGTLLVILRITQPIATIAAAMRAVAHGDLDRKAPFADRGDEIGDLARALAVFRDKARENRRLEVELVRQERLSALGQLTATVAHELRNPLSAIRNTVYTFKETAASKGIDLRRPIERIERSVTRCDRIISELLDYTRVRDLHRGAAPFDKWLDEVLAEQALPDGVTLVRNLSAPGHAISFDADRMRQVVINVIENAAQAMTPAGGKSDHHRIVVTTAARLDAFELVIADNGPGIPADILPKVFEPLFSTKSFGTGLGLPMVKQVIEQHGGTVEIASTPGKGTKVTLRLPHVAAAEVAA